MEQGNANRRRTVHAMHIGHRIREVAHEQGHTSVWLARELGCDRTNIYRIYDKQSLDSSVLLRISRILRHNFLAELADEVETE